MPSRNQQPSDKPANERRTPIANDVDPDGMDSESEGDELEAGPNAAGEDDDDVDEDPSGIATYSQAGSAFGFGLLWTLLFSYPLMGGIQEISARVGIVTGRGLAGNIRQYFPRPVLYAVVGVLVTANIINIAADIG